MEKSTFPPQGRTLNLMFCQPVGYRRRSASRLATNAVETAEAHHALPLEVRNKLLCSLNESNRDGRDFTLRSPFKMGEVSNALFAVCTSGYKEPSISFLDLAQREKKPPRLAQRFIHDGVFLLFCASFWYPGRRTASNPKIIPVLRIAVQWRPGIPRWR